VWQYYFYLRDQDWGRMFLRICPYFPFNARVCVNQHEHLARQLQGEAIFFRKAANASCNALMLNVSSNSPTASPSPQPTWRSPSNAGCVSW
jgi:hypothetical protein